MSTSAFARCARCVPLCGRFCQHSMGLWIASGGLTRRGRLQRQARASRDRGGPHESTRRVALGLRRLARAPTSGCREHGRVLSACPMWGFARLARCLTAHRSMDDNITNSDRAALGRGSASCAIGPGSRRRSWPSVRAPTTRTSRVWSTAGSTGPGPPSFAFCALSMRTPVISSTRSRNMIHRRPVEATVGWGLGDTGAIVPGDRGGSVGERCPCSLRSSG